MITDQQIAEIEARARTDIPALISALRQAREDCKAMASNWAHVPGTGDGTVADINCWHCDADPQPVLMENFVHAPDCLAVKCAMDGGTR